MPQTAVIGRPNAGKTAFTISFATYLGFQSLRFQRRDLTESVAVEYSTELARAELVSPLPHKTTQLQALELECAVGKGKRGFELVDTCGLMEGVHPQEQIRRAMAQSLLLIRDAALVLHLIDAAELGRGKELGALERELATWGEKRGNFLVLATKMDLAGARGGLEKIKDFFSQLPVIATSAVSGLGFREVKKYVLRVL